MYNQREPLRAYCERMGMVMEAYSPLGYNEFKGATEPSVLTNPEICAIAEEVRLEKTLSIL